jgi:hypothetical protein
MAALVLALHGNKQLLGSKYKEQHQPAYIWDCGTVGAYSLRVAVTRVKLQHFPSHIHMS